MYLMHHAFRRDLRRFEAAVRATPLGEVAAWNALARRWDRFAEVLHHHHQVEDEYIWPVLERHAADDGETSATQMLHAMEAEHAQIDPALAAVEASFRAMAAHPCADHRNALDVRVTAVRAALLDHLRHEETDALPYLQRVATPQEEKAMAQGAGARYPLSITPFVVPWVGRAGPGRAHRAVPPRGRRGVRADAARLPGPVPSWRTSRLPYAMPVRVAGRQNPSPARCASSHSRYAGRPPFAGLARAASASRAARLAVTGRGRGQGAVPVDGAEHHRDARERQPAGHRFEDPRPPPGDRHVAHDARGLDLEARRA